MKNKPVIKKCPHCRKLFTLGVNGVVGGCDNCMGQRRDRDGSAWGKGESSARFVNVGDELDQAYTVKWDEVKP